ncbi:MAG: hypothetical protein M1831_002469 [Alyxoria varia]|nr:MAG: hypothetical protein M1831_002469 [Alyxoria varia]
MSFGWKKALTQLVKVNPPPVSPKRSGGSTAAGANPQGNPSSTSSDEIHDKTNHNNNDIDEYHDDGDDDDHRKPGSSSSDSSSSTKRSNSNTESSSASPNLKNRSSTSTDSIITSPTRPATAPPVSTNKVTSSPERPATASSRRGRLRKAKKPSSQTSSQVPPPPAELTHHKQLSPTMSTILTYLRLPIAVTSTIIASASGLLYWKQNELIYPRNMPPGSRTEVPSIRDPSMSGAGLSHLADRTEDLYLDTPDGERLNAVLIKAERQAGAGSFSSLGRYADGTEEKRGITILMFHGNAGNIGHRLPIAAYLNNVLNCNVMMLEYRGYGYSTGTPDEKGLNVDAQTALEYIRSRKEDLARTNLFIYGQSLGGAVGVQLAARGVSAGGDIKGLILENTFLSIRKLIPDAFPPAKYLAPLCHQIWPTEETIQNLPADLPLLFLSGLDDEIVPSWHMQRLHSLSVSTSKRMCTFPGGQHNSTVACQGYFQEVERWVWGILGGGS